MCFFGSFIKAMPRKCGPDYLRHFDILFNETDHNTFDKNEIVKNAYIETEDGVLPNIGINDEYMNNNNNMENEYDFDFNDDLHGNEEEDELEYAMFDNDIIRGKQKKRRTKMTRSKPNM